MARRSSLTEATLARTAVAVATKTPERGGSGTRVDTRTIRRWIRRDKRSRSRSTGRLVDAIDATEGRGPLGQDDLIYLLEREARKGSVRAIELLLRRPGSARTPTR
jgi:hypothetical protein